MFFIISPLFFITIFLYHVYNVFFPNDSKPIQEKMDPIIEYVNKLDVKVIKNIRFEYLNKNKYFECHYIMTKDMNIKRDYDITKIQSNLESYTKDTFHLTKLFLDVYHLVFIPKCKINTNSVSDRNNTLYKYNMFIGCDDFCKEIIKNSHFTITDEDLEEAIRCRKYYHDNVYCNKIKTMIKLNAKIKSLTID